MSCSDKLPLNDIYYMSQIIFGTFSKLRTLRLEAHKPLKEKKKPLQTFQHLLTALA